MFFNVLFAFFRCFFVMFRYVFLSIFSVACGQNLQHAEPWKTAFYSVKTVVLATSLFSESHRQNAKFGTNSERKMIQKLQAKTFKKTCKKHQKTIENRCKNRPKTAMTLKIDEKRFSALSPRPSFSPQVDFWVPAGSQNGLRDTPGTLQILRQSWWRLKNRPDRLLGASREAFGRPPSTPRVPRGTFLGRFFNDFWSWLWHAKLQWHSIFRTRIFHRILRLGAWLWLGRLMNTW